jgi:hypothetical protein
MAATEATLGIISIVIAGYKLAPVVVRVKATPILFHQARPAIYNILGALPTPPHFLEGGD